MDFRASSDGVPNMNLKCSPEWKAACEAPVQSEDRFLHEHNAHSARRLAREIDYDEHCETSASQDNTQGRKRKYDEAWETEDFSHHSSPESPERAPAGGFQHHCRNPSTLTDSSVDTDQYTEQLSGQLHGQNNSSANTANRYKFVEDDCDEDSELDSPDDISDDEISDDEYDSDEDLYGEDDFVYEPPTSHPEWTSTMSPSLNPTRHSTPPEVMKWVYWPPIYESLEQARHQIGCSLRKTVCVKAALTNIEFADLSMYNFPYGAMGKLRPTPRLTHLPYGLRMRNLRTSSPLRVAEECRYPDGSCDEQYGWGQRGK